MNVKRILLIHSSHYDDQGNVVRADKFFDRILIPNVAHSALFLLAGHLPENIDVEVVEDCFENINYDDDCQVVGISAQVMQIDRARDIAREFKKKGKIVLMGGYLPTMHGKLIEDVVDSYCVGEGDQVFPQMILDIEKGELKKKYIGNSSFELSKLPIPRYDLIKKSHFTLYPIQATRGCPFRCDYCSIIEFAQHTYRKRPVEDVIRDIKATKSKNIYFVDDNLMEDIPYSKKLFTKMKGLGVVWGTQTSINCASDPELLKLAYESGCRFVALGMESLDQATLNKMNKSFNRISTFKEQIRRIHQSGISAHILVIIGLDSDTKGIAEKYLTFLNEENIAIAEFFLCTPYPQTPFGKRMKDEGRIIDENLAHYREGHLVFKHPNLSENEILQEYWRALKGFYRLGPLVRRILKGTFKNKVFHFINAINYYFKVKRNIVPVYIGKSNKEIKI